MNVNYFEKAINLYKSIAKYDYLMDTIQYIRMDTTDHDTLWHGYLEWLNNIDNKKSNKNLISNHRNGNTIPSRKDLIKMSFYLEFNAEQCNQLLTSFGTRQLIIRNKNDFLIYYYLNKHIKFDPSILDNITSEIKVKNKAKMNQKYKMKYTPHIIKQNQSNLTITTGQITTFNMLEQLNALEIKSTDSEDIKKGVYDLFNNYSECFGIFNNTARRIVIDILHMQNNAINTDINDKSKSFEENKILQYHIETLTNFFGTGSATNKVANNYLNSFRLIPRVLFIYLLILSPNISDINQINKFLKRSNYHIISENSIEDMLLMHLLVNIKEKYLEIDMINNFYDIVKEYLNNLGFDINEDKTIDNLSSLKRKTIKSMFPNICSLINFRVDVN